MLREREHRAFIGQVEALALMRDVLTRYPSGGEQPSKLIERLEMQLSDQLDARDRQQRSNHAGGKGPGHGLEVALNAPHASVAAHLESEVLRTN